MGLALTTVCTGQSIQKFCKLLCHYHTDTFKPNKRLKLKKVVVEGKRGAGAKSIPGLASPLMKGQDPFHISTHLFYHSIVQCVRWPKQSYAG